MKVAKVSATIPFSREVLRQHDLMRWEYVEPFYNPAYRRKVTSRTWVPVSEEELAKYDQLIRALAAVEDDLCALGAEKDNGGEWEPPTGHVDIEYAETEEEWEARCIELDKAKTTP